MDFPLAPVCIAMIGFVAFYQWLRHQRRLLIHRERLAALEKGVELPPPERETPKRVERAADSAAFRPDLDLAGRGRDLVAQRADRARIAGRGRDSRRHAVDRPGAGRNWPVTPDRVFRGAKPGQVAFSSRRVPHARSRPAGEDVGRAFQRKPHPRGLGAGEPELRRAQRHDLADVGASLHHRGAGVGQARDVTHFVRDRQADKMAGLPVWPALDAIAPRKWNRNSCASST